MGFLLTVAALMLPAAISGLQICSAGTGRSPSQIQLDVSTTQINTAGGMCSCRLTVSHPVLVDMFTNAWKQQCDSYMTVQKWGYSTQCTNGVVPTPSGQIHMVSFGEEILILVVASKPGAKGLSGQLSFMIQQSGMLNLECFAPNTNSSTTTTTSTTLVSTTSSTSRRNVATTTSPLPKTTRMITSASQPITHTGTVSSPDTTAQAQLTSPPGSTGGTRTTHAPCTQDLRAGCHIGGIFAAGVATGVGLVLIAGGLYVVISRRKWWTFRRHKPNDIPLSDAHPTYSGFTPRTEEPMNTYDKIDPKPSKGTDNPYINVS
ncbi:uncharacterized protein [Haliotis asinina]|uniref:uncharacterized protein isoform X2 n=1 Tax=Haliotis asinina TaxID=109174 RepID=UPI0035322E89